MNFSLYPIQDSDFHKTGEITLSKPEKNCLKLQGYNETCSPNVMNGYHKPLNEICKPIYNNQTDNDPKNNCTSVWNNLTKRKSLVKDY